MTRAAVFDVDGTLVDTNYLHAVSWWEAFRQAGHTVEMSAVHRALGRPGPDLVAELLGPDRDTRRDGPLSAAHSILYATYFERLAAFRRVPELLRALADLGWQVVLASSATGTELAALRRAINADDVIAHTASADDVSEGKPAPEPVRLAREAVGAPAERTVFVGDSVWDMRAAVSDGAVPVAVLCGGVPRADLVQAGARTVYRDPAQLLAELPASPFMTVR
ncbi:HAD family hydrolase [Streptomyces sp. OF3]|uniref:HAD family hydrolase n=1 Tax=Streptomyces alkaliterrae TaxID=2213162 RepID=A0A7W3WJ05_9ACTN|nr:HAD family hydrolase [Streptomyces alkaliterrae]MBB1253262.1 HAD family hydrolase [Streptomyces alkaliterrae]